MHVQVVSVVCHREERSKDTEGQIRFLVYTLELASKLADASGVAL